jgi:hypothetical protein
LEVGEETGHECHGNVNVYWGKKQGMERGFVFSTAFFLWGHGLKKYEATPGIFGEMESGN